MAQSFGELVDKLTIERIRESKLWEAAEKDKKLGKKASSVGDKCTELEKEINGYLVAAISGTIKIKDEKNKFYFHEDPTKFDYNTVGALISHLLEANLTLWNLEDKRRDTSLSPEERLKAADTVSIVNRRRNDLSDSLNEKLEELIKKKKVKK